VEVTRAHLDRIARLDPALHAYVTVLPESALAEARAAEAEIARGAWRGPLHGVPIAVKDLCATKGVRTTAGTRVLADWIPDFDAAVVERLRAAGAVLLGKLAMTEAAYATHHPSVTPPVNPWSASASPGASSSGSGVATAAALCFASLGSDTGGSIRFPSAWCGIVGLKPTWGRVPRHGVFPLAESLDHVGPMTRRVADAASLLGAIAGADPRDPTAAPEPVPDYAAALAHGVRGLCIGVDERWIATGTDPRVAEAVLVAVDALAKLGAEPRRVRVPDTAEVIRAWVPLCATEAAHAHRETFPARADEYGPPFRAFLEDGRRLAAADYAAAHLARLAFAGRLATTFEDVDLLACPSAPVPPPPVAILSDSVPLDWSRLEPLLAFTAPFDCSGSPTLSLPCGFTDDGLPLSLQLVARGFHEASLLRAGHAYEQATEWHARRPPNL
jgi:amidase